MTLYICSGKIIQASFTIGGRWTVNLTGLLGNKTQLCRCLHRAVMLFADAHAVLYSDLKLVKWDGAAMSLLVLNVIDSFVCFTQSHAIST